jgi:hypothetical protein
MCQERMFREMNNLAGFFTDPHRFRPSPSEGLESLDLDMKEGVLEC